MGRPLPRRRTSRTSRRAELNAVLFRSIEAVAATNPATEAAARTALTSTITRTAATRQAELAQPGAPSAKAALPALAELAAQPSLLTLPIVFVDGVEVTQAIQDMNQTVPLVAGKKTVVRAYVNYAPSAKDVRGELMASRSLAGPWVTIPSIGTAKLDPSRTGHTLAALRDRRRNLGYSLNFAVPDALTGPGALWVRLSRVTATDGQQLPLFSFFPKQVTFTVGAPLRLRLIRIRYASGSPAVTYLPTATDQSNIASWLPRAYPTNALQMTVTTVDAAVPAPFEAASINAQLAGIRAQDRAAGTDGRTHYFGLVSDGAFFMRGLAAGIPATPQPSTVASGPTGSGTWGWDTDGSYGDWYTGHELGHTFGRFHAEFCGAIGGAPYPYPDGQLSGADEAFEGLDVGDPALGFPMAVMSGTDWHDVMTYCAKEWLSPFTYRGIMDRLVAEDALGPGTNAGPTPGEGLIMDASEMQVHVVAAVNLTQRSAQIASALPLPAAGGHEAAGVADDGGPIFVVRVVGAAGEVLHSQPAPFLPSACSIEGEDQTGLVDTVVPNVAGAAAVELLLDGEVLDRFDVGDGAVAPQLVGPGVAGLVAGTATGATITLNWAAPDAPAGQRYIVQVSADGGASWSTLAAGTPATSLEVDRDDFPGATALEVRITATSGFGQPSVVTEHVAL